MGSQKTFLQGTDSHGRYANLHPSFANKIWMPDIYIDQVLKYVCYSMAKLSSLTQGSKYETTSLLCKTRISEVIFLNFREQQFFCRLYNSSLIRYESRVNYDVGCAMDFRRYPLDNQVGQLCNLTHLRM